MLEPKALKDLLHQKGLTNLDKLILCLAVNDQQPKSVADVKKIALGGGLTKVKKWNVSAHLSSSKGLAIRTDDGWELTGEGRTRVATLAGSALGTPVPKVAATLRSKLAAMKDKDTVTFLDEAIQCYEHGLYRAAVVLSWVGAVSLLYEFVRAKKLKEFNSEAKRRDAKWKNAKSKDDLTRMKEYDFLQIINALSIIGKNVKEELEICLKLRNGCGHPSSLKVGENRVTAHIETLILNVFDVF